MKWIYLSPHFDDVALSCGGLVWEQTCVGEAVEVWTVCGGDPPKDGLSPLARSLHARWNASESPVSTRRQEDRSACAVLGAGFRHFDIPDCVYRSGADGTAFYASEQALFGSLHSEEANLIDTLAVELAAKLPSSCQLVAPLAIGGHVDHRLTRAAAEAIGRPVWYYADYPYVTYGDITMAGYLQSGWQRICYPVSQAGLQAWGNAIGAYRSQISTFWESEGAMRVVIGEYWKANDCGVCLWMAPAQN